MKKRQLFLWILVFLCGSIFPQDVKSMVKPTTNFSWDKKYQAYYAFKNIAISNYYELEEVIPIHINNDEKEDYLILLTPKSLLCPLDDAFDFDMNKFYRRCLLEVISDGNKYVVGIKYNTLISNIAGLGTGYDGLEKHGDGILIKHAKPNGNIYWEINMYFKYDSGILCLYRINGIDMDGTTFEQKLDNVNADNICISDFY